MSKSSLTAYLLSSPETTELYERATRSQFLSLAGEGRLPKDVLSQWLSQDRLYAQAYVRFIGGLISRVQLPAVGDASKSLDWRILSLLQTALSGIARELQFFEATAKKYGLDLDALGPVAEGGNLTSKSAGFGANKVTGDYIDLFDSFAAQPCGDTSKTLMDGLVLLWTTEMIYLDSWTYAKQQQAAEEQGTDVKEDADGGALRKEFIPNWTSDEFRAFVDECRECLDAYAAVQILDTEEVGAASSMTLFKKVLVLEESFWPMVA
ncbi:heme oxygenase-like protein [Hypoxylon sp. FL1284]|nr:heme oxygenase-like protein [Hypoxylon sp. FL1284]